MKILPIFLVFFFIIFSCKKNEEKEIVPIDYSYYPLEIGNFVIYDVENVSIDKIANINETLKYQLKDKITESYIDDVQNIVYKIERYKRDKNTDPWEILLVQTTSIDKNKVYRTEQNHKYIKMIFPLEQDKEWDGNGYNNKGVETYIIKNTGKQEVINGINFDKVLEIEQANYETLVNKNYFIEKYAKNVGLIYKETTYLEDKSVEIDYTVPLMQRITNGTSIKMAVKEYGKE